MDIYLWICMDINCGLNDWMKKLNYSINLFIVNISWKTISLSHRLKKNAISFLYSDLNHDKKNKLIY